MSTLAWIVATGALMSVIALVGSFTLLMNERTLERIILPLVALAAGTLLGGALLHLLPAAVDVLGNHTVVYLAFLAGFLVFFVLEVFLHWHHCHHTGLNHKQPLGYLILIADGAHNFLGGLGVGGAFVLDTRVGLLAFVAAAAHEIPQELGDFGVLVHGGWSRKKALLYNLVSALTFPLGGVLAYVLARGLDVAPLLAFAAGNFVYIAAVDLVPEITRHESLKRSAEHFAAFVGGLALLWAVGVWLEPLAGH